MTDKIQSGGSCKVSTITKIPVIKCFNLQILARAKTEAPFNIYNFLKENIKSTNNTKDKVKTRRMVPQNNNNGSNQQKNNFARCFARLKCETSFNFLFTRFMEEIFVLLFTLSFHCRSFSPWQLLAFLIFSPPLYIIVMFFFQRNWYSIVIYFSLQLFS